MTTNTTAVFGCVMILLAQASVRAGGDNKQPAGTASSDKTSVPDRRPAANVSPVANANNKLGWKVADLLTQQNPGNWIFSPPSVTTGLYALHSGAGGVTRDELGKLLGLPEKATDADTIKAAAAWQARLVTKSSSALGLTVTGEKPKGLRVTSVEDGSAAQVAGVKPGNLILSLNGRPAGEVADTYPSPTPLAAADEVTVIEVEDQSGAKTRVVIINQAGKGLPTRGYDLQAAVGFFGGAKYQWKKDFEDGFRAYFPPGIRPTDFSKPTEAVDRINRFVQSETNNRVKELVTKAAVNEQTRLVIVSTTWFRAKWRDPFDVKKTATAKFTVPAASHTVPAGGQEKIHQLVVPMRELLVPMMSKKGSYPVRQSDASIGVEVPYESGEAAMWLFLPKEGKAVSDVLTEVSEKNPALVAAEFEPTEVELALPRFSFRHKTDLKPTLLKLGISSAFSAEKADFARMTDSKPGLVVSAINQEAFISVDEEGTEASAATTIALVPKSKGLEVSLNRPFVFAIVQKATNTILFVGKVSEPELSVVER